MSGEQYMQVRRPVSRLAEKVLGWLSWVFLLLLTIATMFIALVSFSSETSIQNLETSLNGNEFIQQILANNGMTSTQAVIWLQNGIWAVIVFLIVCLLISFLALISMNIRMLSGFLFLIATLITLPLVLLFVTLIIPVLFLIVSIMMFARKEKVEAIPAYYGYDDDYEDDVYEPAKKRRSGSPQQEATVESEPVEQHSEPAEEGEDTKEKNELRRGGYSSEVARQVNADIADEEPQVLSRQAKYNYKKKKDNQNHDDDFGQVSSVYGEGNDDYVSQEEQQKQEELQRQQAEEARRKQQEAEEQERLKQEKAEEAQRLKQEKAEEKARIKEEKKERKKRIKEKRKQQPSAVAQRRMNYEERKKVTSQEDDNQSEETQQDEKER